MPALILIQCDVINIDTTFVDNVSYVDTSSYVDNSYFVKSIFKKSFSVSVLTYNILILAKVHHRVYSRVIREVTSKFGIRELQLSLTRDGEDFLTWNKNLQTPNGAFLTATFYPR